MISPDEFVVRFFGEGNGIWPGLDPSNPVGQHLSTFLDALAYPGECPVMLPRRRLITQPNEWYVITRDRAHAGRTRALLESAVAHSWVPFDGRVAALDPTDPVHKAILDFRGEGTTFVLKPTSGDAEIYAVRALRRLAGTLAGRPLRTPAVPRPVGRMLREFDVALSAGAIEQSEAILSEIESVGGISHENIAYLRVRRISRLGREAELLANGSLAALVYTEPPFLVREAVLGAWARVQVLPLLAAEGLDAALTAVQGANPDIAMLVDGAMLRTTDDEVAAVCALVASARGDRALAASFLDGREQAEFLASLLVEMQTPEPKPVLEPELPPELTTHPGSWLDWVALLGTGADIPLAFDTAEAWAPAWTVDGELAAAIDALPTLAEDNLLSGVAALLDTDDPDHSAPATAASLINRYLLSERFDPADLTAICALLQIFVRSGPAPERYDALLGDIRQYANQWVSVLKAVQVIDIADAVACGPAGDKRDSFVAALLGPLNAQKSRLPGSLRGLASLVADELDLGLNWNVGDADGSQQEVASAAAELEPRILIYSLDSGTLARAKAAIKQQWPGAVVETSADRVGNPALKQHARNADVIVLATRRAAHAATGFIASNAAATALIGYADGSGSASMLRAVESVVGEWSV